MATRAPHGVLLALLLTFLVPLSASTQEATPTVDLDIAAPEECVVDPRPVDELLALATPVAQSETDMATPAPPAVPFEAPHGEPADSETVAAFTAVTRQSWACLNANDWPRFFALLTDEEIQRGFAPNDIVALGTGDASAEALPALEQTVMLATLDVEVLPDGRVGGYVLVDTADDPLPVEVNYMIAVETEAGWRVDGFVCYDAQGNLC